MWSCAILNEKHAAELGLLENVEDPEVPRTVFLALGNLERVEGDVTEFKGLLVQHLLGDLEPEKRAELLQTLLDQNEQPRTAQAAE